MKYSWYSFRCNKEASMMSLSETRQGTFTLKRDFNFTKFNLRVKAKVYATDDEVEFRPLQGMKSVRLSEADLQEMINNKEAIVIYYTEPNKYSSRIDYYNCDEMQILEVVLAS